MPLEERGRRFSSTSTAAVLAFCSLGGKAGMRPKEKKAPVSLLLR
jgi:hypothetical protein